MLKFLQYIIIMSSVINCASNNLRNLPETYTVSRNISFNLSNFSEIFPNGFFRHDLLTFRNKDQIQNFQVILKKSSNKVNITILSLIGMELSSINISNKKINILTNHNFLNQRLINRILGDIYIVFASSDFINKQDSQIRLVNQPSLRTLMYKDSKEISVFFNNNNNIKLINHSFHYTIDLKQIKK